MCLVAVDADTPLTPHIHTHTNPACCVTYREFNVTNNLSPVSRVLDVSFNRVREIEGLGQLHKLEKLFLCANKISRIENLNHLKNLTLLELGDNKIRASRPPASDLALCA
jgi:hypothetical protein